MEKPYDDKVAKTIAGIRRKTRMTQEQFAQAIYEELGDSKRGQILGHWVSRWESGRYMPGADILLASMAVVERYEREGSPRPPSQRLELDDAVGPAEAYMTAGEAATALKIARTGLYGYQSKGLLTLYRLGTRTVFDRAAVKTLAESLR